MDQQIIEDYKRATTSTTITEQLRTEREFRYFLLHLLDTSYDNIELVNAIAPLYQSELSKIKGASQAKKDKEFGHILKLFTDGDEPVNIGVDLSTDERRNLLISLLPEEELSSLRNQILNLDMPAPLFRSMAHTFNFYSNLEHENNSLEKRLQSLRDVRHFTPESNDVFIPTRPTTALATPRSTSSTQTQQPSTSRPYSTIKNRPTTPRISTSSRMGSSKIQTARFRSTSKIDTSVVDNENVTLREQIKSKAKELKQSSKYAKQLRAQIENRIRDVAYVQKEILSLEEQLEDLNKESLLRTKEQVTLDETAKEIVLQKKREANDVTTQLHNAIEDNRRLKELLAKEQSIPQQI